MCSPGYTGVSCSSCEEGLVLVDGFECQVCPEVSLMVMFLGLGLCGLGIYVCFQLAEKGEEQSEVAVFYKIVLTTCQVNATGNVSSSLDRCDVCYMCSLF